MNLNDRAKRTTPSRRALTVAGVATLVFSLVVSIGPALAAPGGNGGGGNAGTVKIHDATTNLEAGETGNEPWVCTFWIGFYTTGAAETGDWQVVSWPPTGDGTVVTTGSYDTTGDGADTTEVFSIAEGHYRLEWQAITDTTSKHKTFWVACEDEDVEEGVDPSEEASPSEEPSPSQDESTPSDDESPSEEPAPRGRVHPSDDEPRATSLRPARTSPPRRDESPSEEPSPSQDESTPSDDESPSEEPSPSQDESTPSDDESPSEEPSPSQDESTPSDDESPSEEPSPSQDESTPSDDESPSEEPSLDPSQQPEQDVKGGNPDHHGIGSGGGAQGAPAEGGSSVLPDTATSTPTSESGVLATIGVLLILVALAGTRRERTLPSA